MKNTIEFTCTSLAGVNKAGLIKRTDKGYYPMVVGALNMHNSAGQFYEAGQAKRLFDQSSQFQRRVARGALRGEYGHPKRQLNQDRDAYTHRVLSIHEEMVCCHHRRIWLEENLLKDNSGKPVIAIMSEVNPSGPYGNVLEKQLLNTEENVCFSIRAFTDDQERGLVTHRKLRTIITFDYVNEPGMSVAEKYKSPALESSDSMQITRGVVERVAKYNSQPDMAQESVTLSLEELSEALGWNMSKEAQSDFQRRAAWSGW